MHEKKQPINNPGGIEKYTVATNGRKYACKNYKCDPKSNLLLKCQLLHISSPRLVSIANVMPLKRCQHHVFGGTFLWTDR